MDIPLDEVIYFDAVTHRFDTGAVTDADSTPTFAVYEEATDTDIGVGGNLTKRTSLTGNYRGTFTLSAANGFEVGKWYSIIASATVNSVAGKGVIKNFRVVAAEATAGYPVTTHKVGTGTGEVNSSSGKVPATIAAGDIANNAITAAAVADGAIDRATFAADTGLQAVRSNTAQAGGATSITLDASASSTTDFYKYGLIYITGGTGAGQVRLITAYNGSTKVATITPAWATNPDNTSSFAVLPAGITDNEAFGGTAGSYSSGKPAVGAADSVTGAVGSVTGNVGGNVTGSVGSVVGAVGSVTGNLGGNVNGNVVGSVASVAGAVGSVTGAVGSVSGDVGGKVLGGGSGTITGDGVQAASVTGAVGSVSGAVGSVTGNVGGNVTGNVSGNVAGKVLGGGAGSITGDGVRAESVTGAVGSVTGNVGGNVTGSVGSVVGAVGSVTGNVGGSVGSLGAQAKSDVAANSELLDWEAVDPGDIPNRCAMQAGRAIRNKHDFDNGIVYKEDDTTQAWTYTKTTNAAAEPVTGVDPA